MKKDVLGSQSEEATIPDVELPGTKLGLKMLVDVFRSPFHRYPKHIGGDIVFPPVDEQPSVAKASDVKKPVEVTVYFRQGRNQSQSLSVDAARDDVNLVVQRAAELALEQVNPYLLAAYEEDHREFEKAARLVEKMTLDPSQDLLHQVACLNLWGDSWTIKETSRGLRKVRQGGGGELEIC